MCGVMSHLHKLAHDIGARPAGSRAHHAAEAYIRDVFHAAGLHTEDVRLDFPDWTCHDAALSFNGRDLPVNVNPFSPSCDVTARTVAVCTLAELEAATLKDNIALLYGDLSRGPIFPQNFTAYQPERDRAINRLLIEKAPAAVLAVNLDPGRRVHIIEDEDMPLPSATVSVEVGRDLLLHAGEHIHLRIDSHSQPSHVTTVIGRTPGQDRIVLCAHYDTKVGTPGAYDNGSGVAALLALAERLARHDDLSIGLEFVAWADEEYGAHTDEAYVQRFADDLGHMLCAINMDGIGLLPETTTLTMLASSDAFEGTVREISARYPAITWVDPWPASNHSTYAARGVPSIALSSVSWYRAHQAGDTVDWISESRLEEVVALVTDIVTAVHEQSPAWTR